MSLYHAVCNDPLACAWMVHRLAVDSCSWAIASGRPGRCSRSFRARDKWYRPSFSFGRRNFNISISALLDSAVEVCTFAGPVCCGFVVFSRLRLRTATMLASFLPFVGCCYICVVSSASLHPSCTTAHSRRHVYCRHQPVFNKGHKTKHSHPQWRLTRYRPPWPSMLEDCARAFL